MKVLWHKLLMLLNIYRIWRIAGFIGMKREFRIARESKK